MMDFTRMRQLLQDFQTLLAYQDLYREKVCTWLR